MKKPFGRFCLMGLVVVSILLTSVLPVSTLPANAQVEEYAGAEQGLPLEALPAASEPSPEVGYDPGEGPGLPEQPQPESDLTPDGLPLDSLATEAAPEEPPALPEEMLGSLSHRLRTHTPRRGL